MQMLRHFNESFWCIWSNIVGPLLFKLLHATRQYSWWVDQLWVESIGAWSVVDYRIAVCRTFVHLGILPSYWCLTSLSSLRQLYCGGHLYCYKVISSTHRRKRIHNWTLIRNWLHVRRHLIYTFLIQQVYFLSWHNIT